MLEWTVKIRVTDNWVEDGFACDAESVKEAILSHCLGYATPDEVQVEVIDGPPAETMRRLRGESEMKYYQTREAAYQDVARRHGVEPEDLDLIPGEGVQYLSYGPADEDVEAVLWEKEEE